VELNPNPSFAHSQYAIYLVTTGQSANAESEIKRALELDPLSPLQRSIAGFLFCWVRQYDRSIKEGRRVVEADYVVLNLVEELARRMRTNQKQ